MLFPPTLILMLAILPCCAVSLVHVTEIFIYRLLWGHSCRDRAFWSAHSSKFKLWASQTLSLSLQNLTLSLFPFPLPLFCSIHFFCFVVPLSLLIFFFSKLFRATIWLIPFTKFILGFSWVSVFQLSLYAHAVNLHSICSRFDAWPWAFQGFTPLSQWLTKRDWPHNSPCPTLLHPCFFRICVNLSSFSGVPRCLLGYLFFCCTGASSGAQHQSSVCNITWQVSGQSTLWRRQRHRHIGLLGCKPVPEQIRPPFPCTFWSGRK